MCMWPDVCLECQFLCYHIFVAKGNNHGVLTAVFVCLCGQVVLGMLTFVLLHLCGQVMLGVLTLSVWPGVCLGC